MTAATASAWSPFARPAFRMLWVGWLVTNLCLWMNDVAAAWLMTSLSTSPLMVALVQSASTMPVFLLGVPSGALADIVDRRHILIFTQIWLALVALLLTAAAFSGALGPATLLILTFLNGVGLALRWPAYAATMPELVPRTELPAALGLNGIGMNASRIFGPIAAGAIIAAFGGPYVFALNAALAIATGAMLIRWRRQTKESTLPSERFLAAIRVGVQHVRQSPAMHAILLRSTLFMGHSTVVIALLPLVARRFVDKGGAGTYTILLAAMGSGAIAIVPMLPRLRDRMTRDQLVNGGMIVLAAATAVLAFVPNVYAGIACMFVAGAMWISIANTLAVAAQITLPDWARARGMAIYQTALMGGSAGGAAIWGEIANLASVRVALVACALSGVLTTLISRRFTVGGRIEEDLTPAGLWKAPELAVPVEPEQGPVLVTIEYDIEPGEVDAFLAVMRESRRSWLANGLLAWELYLDVTHPGRYIEHLTDESWAEYLRRNERVTNSYIALRERKVAFHRGTERPSIRRYVARQP